MATANVYTSWEDITVVETTAVDRVTLNMSLDEATNLLNVMEMSLRQLNEVVNLCNSSPLNIGRHHNRRYSEGTVLQALREALA